MPMDRVSEPLRKYGVRKQTVETVQQKRRWTEDDYLNLIERRGVEFANGVLEFLPVPTNSHQAIFEFLFEVLKAFVIARGLGKVRSGGIRVKLPGGLYREPDLVFVLAEHLSWIGEKCWEGADLVMEIVSSPDGRDRDLNEKRAEYANARIKEYWIIDPQLERIVVLKLKGKKYVEHGVFKKGELATSALLKGFSADVSAVLNAD